MRAPVRVVGLSCHHGQKVWLWDLCRVRGRAGERVYCVQCVPDCWNAPLSLRGPVHCPERDTAGLSEDNSCGKWLRWFPLCLAPRPPSGKASAGAEPAASSAAQSPAVTHRARGCRPHPKSSQGDCGGAMGEHTSPGGDLCLSVSTSPGAAFPARGRPHPHPAGPHAHPLSVGLKRPTDGTGPESHSCASFGQIFRM